MENNAAENSRYQEIGIIATLRPFPATSKWHQLGLQLIVQKPAQMEYIRVWWD